MSRIQKLAFIAFFLCLTVALTNTHLTYKWLRNSSDPGWVEGHADGKLLVLRVRTDSQASVLRSGDEVLLLNGRPFPKGSSIYQAFEGIPVGSSYYLKIKREGKEQEYTLYTQPFSTIFWIAAIMAIGTVPLLFLFFAFLLILFSQGDRRALLLACAFALTIPDIPFFSLTSAPWWQVMIMVIGRPLSYLSFPLYLQFSLNYPEESRLLARYPWLHRKLIFYAPYFLFGFLGSLIITLAAYISPATAFSLRNSLPGFIIRYGLILIYLPVAFYAIAQSHRHPVEVIRQKVKLIKRGLAIGFIPLIARSFLLLFIGLLPFNIQSQFGVSLLDLFALVVFTSLASLPVFFMVAITTHELVHLSGPIKRAVKYLLVRSVYLAIFFILLLGFTYAGLYLSFKFYLTNSRWLIPAVICVAMIPLILLKIAEQVERQYINVYIKDRSIGLTDDIENGLEGLRTALMAFFRKALSRVKTELDLNALCSNVQREVRDAIYPKDFTLILAQRIAGIFKADFVAIFAENRSTGDYNLIASASQGDNTNLYPKRLLLPSSSKIVKLLKRRGKLRQSPRQWLQKTREMPKVDLIDPNKIALETLTEINSTCILPAKHDDQVPLIISISRGYALSRREMRALKRVARIAGVESEFAAWRKVTESSHLDVVLENLLIAAVRSIRPAQRGSIYLWHDNLQKLVIHAQYRYMPDLIAAIQLGPGDGFAGKAFQNNEKLIINDFQKDQRGFDAGNFQIKEIKSALYMPFQAWGRTIGILCLDNVDSISAFEEKHLTRVERFGSMVSLAVQNARVQTELRNLGSILDKGNIGCEEILTALFDRVADFTEVKAVTLLLLMDPQESTAINEQKPLLSLAKGFNNDVDYSENVVPRDDGMTAAAIRSLKEIKSDSSEQPREVKFGSPHYQQILNPTALEHGVKAAICFPFQVNEFVIGLLSFKYLSEHYFPESEVEALRLFANEVALGVSNALKREELQYIDQVVWMALLISGLQHDMNQSTDIIENDLLILNHVIAGLPLKDADYASRAITRIQNSVLEIQSHQERMIKAWMSDFSLVNLHDLVIEIAERSCRVHPEISVDLTNFYDNAEALVSAIPLQIHLVVKNLVSNAVRAAKGSSNPTLILSKKVVGHRIEVIITNTGEPIPPEIKMKLFKEIIQENALYRAGHGMGLWIGRRIVRRHGGDLDLVKSDNTGTTFTFWLPLADENTINAHIKNEVTYAQV